LPDRAALERLARDLGTVIETMNCGIVARDLVGDMVFANETLLRWTGYAREELVGRPCEELAPEELRQVIREEGKATLTGDLRVRLAVLQRKDSSTFPVVLIPQQFINQKTREMEGTFVVLVDLGAVQTAKPIQYHAGDELRESLDRIALQLHVLSLTASLPVSAPMLLSHPDFRELSPREHEVLMHLVAGDRVPVIAKELHISPHTVRNHLKSMYRKLDVSTQSDLIQRVRVLGSEPGRAKNA